MLQKIICLLFLIAICFKSYSQDAPNLSGSAQLSPNAAASSKESSSQVNYFTGIPSIGVPLYSYSGKGMNFNISADYFAGGSKNGESPTTIGLGWYLNAGGSIVRTVRGAPDDMAATGFMNAGQIPTDFRSNGDDYYNDSLDAQPDIFQFNFNGRSGRFFIGKNHQIIIIPQSKLKIEYTLNPTTHLIVAFKITDESGTKYLFNEAELTIQSTPENDNYYRTPYDGFNCNTGWYLSQVISPFNTDTIKINYLTEDTYTTFSYPQAAFFSTSDLSETSRFKPMGLNYTTVKKIKSIDFPSKITANFIYSPTLSYIDTNKALYKLEIGDSVLRKGYLFNYQLSYIGDRLVVGGDNGHYIVHDTLSNSNLLLKSITPYTAKESTKGYSFVYNNPLQANYDAFSAYYTSAYDYWGFFNNNYSGSWVNGFVYNADPIPAVPGKRLGGANRSVNTHAMDNSLSYIYSPTGGVTHYEYELNTVTPNSIDSHILTVNNTTATSQNTVTLTQIFSPVHQLTFKVTIPDRTGTPPLSGTCNLVCNIKNTAGTVTYATTTISLYDIFYQGISSWTFSLANGTYRLETSLSGGGSITSTLAFTIEWDNKIAASGTDTAGGIRIARITHQSAINDNAHTVIEEFKYVKEDGKSSGFFGDIPKYDYTFTQKTLIPVSTTTLTAISSDPIGSLNYAQGAPVGYSRVEVINGTSTKNLGKTVYNFTDLSDVGSNTFYAKFPYVPQDVEDWGIGIPKRIEIYDSSGSLVEKRTSTLVFNQTNYNTSDYKGLKLGCVVSVYAKSPLISHSSNNTYIGGIYYPSTGWISLTNETDTMYHDDGTIQTSNTAYTYDTYYNVSKITSDYDRNHSLKLETRIYHPYDYSFSSGSIKTLKDSNIISPVVSTEKWIIGDANPRMIDANITNFQTLSTKQIVPVASYKFQSNGPVNQSVIGTFNPSSLIRNSTYFIQQTSYSLFDSDANDVQVTNSITGNNSSTIYDYNKQYAVAKVSNASYSDIAYTSFESDGTGNWTIASPLRNKANSITGKQSYDLSNGTVSKTGLNSSTTYLLSGWAKVGATVYINGSSIGIPIATHNGWNFFSSYLSGVSSVVFSGSGLVDEARLIPRDANMITYTYEPNVGITSNCDANNTIVYTEYDNLNRVKLIRDVDMNILKRYDYSDSTFIPNWREPNWVGTGKECKAGAGNEGKFDSVYTDMNTQSDSYLTTIRITQGIDYCMCTTDPSYKVVNGICSHGQKIVTSTYFDRNRHLYVCTYHYKWSDGSISTPDTEITSADGDPCSM